MFGSGKGSPGKGSPDRGSPFGSGKGSPASSDGRSSPFGSLFGGDSPGKDSPGKFGRSPTDVGLVIEDEIDEEDGRKRKPLAHEHRDESGLYELPPNDPRADPPQTWREWWDEKPLKVSLKEPIFKRCCCCCKQRLENYRRGVNEGWDDMIFTQCNLRYRDNNKFFKQFQKLDADRDNDVDIFELLMFLDIERTQFSERLFELMDMDSSNTVSYMEFVVSYWNFCSLTKPGRRRAVARSSAQRRSIE